MFSFVLVHLSVKHVLKYSIYKDLTCMQIPAIVPALPSAKLVVKRLPNVYSYTQHLFIEKDLL